MSCKISVLSLDHIGMAEHLTRSGVYLMQWMELMMICCGMAVTRMGMWGRWRHRLWRWREWHWLVKVERMWHALCIVCMKWIVKYFYLGDVWGRGGGWSSYIWINTFFLGRRVLFGVRLRLELSCIGLNVVNVTWTKELVNRNRRFIICEFADILGISLS